MKRYTSFLAAAAAAVLIVLPVVAMADTVNVTFEPSTYTVGNINGQDGWLKTGPYDVNVTATGIPAGFGTQSMQISDAVTSGSFGDQTFAKPLVNAVGETAATAGAFSVGAKQSHFEMQFAIAATTTQPGLFMSVSPDRGDGSRMSYLGFLDTANGIDINFYDVQGTSNPANFVQTDLGTYSGSVPHTIKLTMDVVDGPSNDVVKVYIDGALVHTGTSWENYYRFDTEASAEQTPRIVKTVLFRAGGTAIPADAGKGYLIDNLSLVSGPTPPSTVKVTIDKFIDGKAASTTSATSTFPMSATWSATNIGSGSGSYPLGSTGFNSPNAYEAITADMTTGASYSTNEVTGGAVVGASCSTGQPYALVGYKVGDTLAAAQATSTSTSTPSFTNLTGNKVVLVLNKICVPMPVHISPANGSTLTSAAFTNVDWTDVIDLAGGITYLYQASHATTTNPDGSFTSPVYTSGALASSSIPTPGTPAGVYFWHVRAVDADGNTSPWTTPWQVTITAGSTQPPPPPAPANACTLTSAPQGYTLRNGTAGNDTVMLLPFTMFVGNGGNDQITAPDGNYIICTGSGNDTISIGSGTSVIDAGAGNNVVKTGDGDQRVTTGAGNDTIKTGAGNDTINAGNGNNTVTAGAGDDMITTGSGNDTIDGGAGTDTCNAGSGHNAVINCELP